MRTNVAGRFEAEDQLSKSDRLFRAAISGFCSMTSATRLDASRLDQLALPLLPLVTNESRRYAAAALSRSFPAPQGLIRRLAEEDVAVSAPVLVGSPVLSDVDLIGLIGRHGLAHAAAIGRRAGLNANIAALVRALGAADIAVEAAADAEASAQPEPDVILRQDAAPAAAGEQAMPPTAANDAPAERAPGPQPQAAAVVDAGPLAEAYDAFVRAEPGAAEEAARDRLREMMMPAGARAPSRAHPRHDLPPLDWDAARAAARNLVSTGLAGKAALFHTAFADAFDLDFRAAAAIVEDSDVRRLGTALKAAQLPEAEAFLIAALAFPPRFVTTAAIRWFFEFYASVGVDRARREVQSWRERAPRRDTAAQGSPEVANLAGEQPAGAAMRALRAS